MVDVEKEIEKSGADLKNYMKKKEFWMVVSAILAVALVVAIAWPSGVSSSKAGTTLVNSLNERVGGGVTLLNISKLGNLYMATVNYQDQEIPVYMTRDGKYMVMGIQELSTSEASNSDTPSTQTKEVPKTSKPVVEAFVFTYCPYGLQFEKAMVPVYNLLKNKVDINTVQIGAMHGEFEQIEAYRQLCIQKNYGKDKLWSYLNKFDTDTKIGACNGDATCLSPLLSALMSSLSIDKSKVDACIAKDAEALYAADMARAKELGQSGSPGFVINGVDVQVSRTPEAIKTAICDAFTDSSRPSECSQNLSSASTSAGFGASSSGSSTAASCG